MHHNEFAEYILRPWEILNATLAKSVAFQTDASVVHRLAGDLSVAIRHLPESFTRDPQAAAKCQNLVLAQSASHAVVRDVADSWKHKHQVKDPYRQCRLQAAAAFEYRSGKFSFLRNIVEVHHPIFGKADLLEVTRAAIRMWIERQEMPVSWLPQIAHATADYQDWAYIDFDPEAQVLFNTIQIRMFERREEKFCPVDPPEVKFMLR